MGLWSIFKFKKRAREFVCTESLKEPFTGTSMPFLTPVLRAPRMACWMKVRPELLAMMYFLIAAGEEPVRSLRALMAAEAISR